MRGFIILFLAFTLGSEEVISQIPFQSVIMDANGIVANDSLKFLVSIEDLNNNPIFQEQHSVKSNDYGLVSFLLSEGVVLLGSWASIDWGADLMMDVQMSRKIQNDWGPMTFYGSQALTAVPFAYYAADANVGPQGEVGDQGDQGPVGETGDQGPQGEIGDTGDQGPNGNYIDTVYWNQDELVFVLSDGTTQSIPASGGKGCKQLGACNYSDAAWIEDGSCHWEGDPCNDQEDFTFADVLDSLCVCHGVDYHLIDSTISIREPTQRSGCNGQTTLLYEGKDYKLVEIDGQCWFAENLKVERGVAARDSFVYGFAENQNFTMYPGYSSTGVEKFGMFYTRGYHWNYWISGVWSFGVYELDSLCPTGWHVSRSDDWNHIEIFSGEKLIDLFSIDFRGSTAGSFASAEAFLNSKVFFNNSLGFSALSSGYGKYDYDTGNFYKQEGAFFHVEPNNGGQLYFPVKTIYRDYIGIRSHFGKDYYSVRCVKD